MRAFLRHSPPEVKNAAKRSIADRATSGGECHEKPLIYKASITPGGTTKHYIGCTETEFKTRYYNHYHSFRYREKRNATQLSKAFWKATNFGHEPVIKCSIADRATAYQPGSRSSY